MSEVRCSRLRLYCRRLLDACGWRFLCFLFFAQCLCKGMLMAIMSNVMLPLFKPYTTAAQLQIYSMVAMLPWSAKPIIGLCSDYLLLCGYRRRGWLLISLCVSAIGITLLCIIPYASIATILGVACIGCIQFQLSMYDLLSEAKYSEIRRDCPEVGSDITTLVAIMHQAGGLIAVSFVGSIADSGSFRILFFMGAAIVASPLLPTLLGWLPEERQGRKWVATTVDRLSIKEQLPYIAIIAFCGGSGILSSIVVTVFESPLIGFIFATIMLTLCLAGSCFVMPPLVTQIAMYQVLTTIAQPSIGTALSYFYTAPATCVADGPHFSYTYYISYAGTTGRIISLLGLLAYQAFLSRLNFRVVLLVPTVMSAVAGLTDWFIVLRFNVAIGLSDQLSYILGQAIIEPFVDSLGSVPASALISIGSESGKEASTFAFLAGISNFSRMVSSLSGAVIISTFGVGTDCDFSSLGLLVLMCHVSFPLLIGVPAVWFIPSMKQDVRS